MIYTTIGLVAGFLLSVIVLALITKRDADAEEWNEMHEDYPMPKTKIYVKCLFVYFGIWIVACLIGWYFLQIIQLGQFFCIAVILPAILVSFVALQ